MPSELSSGCSVFIATPSPVNFCMSSHVALTSSGSGSCSLMPSAHSAVAASCSCGCSVSTSRAAGTAGRRTNLAEATRDESHLFRLENIHYGGMVQPSGSQSPRTCANPFSSANSMAKHAYLHFSSTMDRSAF